MPLLVDPKSALPHQGWEGFLCHVQGQSCWNSSSCVVSGGRRGGLRVSLSAVWRVLLDAPVFLAALPSPRCLPSGVCMVGRALIFPWAEHTPSNTLSSRKSWERGGTKALSAAPSKSVDFTACGLECSKAWDQKSRERETSVVEFRGQWQRISTATIQLRSFFYLLDFLHGGRQKWQVARDWLQKQSEAKQQGPPIEHREP